MIDIKKVLSVANIREVARQTELSEKTIRQYMKGRPVTKATEKVLQMWADGMVDDDHGQQNKK